MKPLPDSFQHVGHTVGLSVFFSVQCTVGLTVTLNEITEIGSIGSCTLGYCCDWQTCFKVSFDWIICRSVLTQAANCFRRFSPIGELLEPVH